MAKYLGVLDQLFWGTHYPFTSFGPDEQYWRAVPDAFCRRLGLEPEVTANNIDALVGPNFAAYLEANAPRR